MTLLRLFGKEPAFRPGSRNEGSCSKTRDDVGQGLRLVAVRLSSVRFSRVGSVRLSRCADHVAFGSSADTSRLLLGADRSFQGRPRFFLSASGRLEGSSRRSSRRRGGIECSDRGLVRGDRDSVSGLRGGRFLTRSPQLRSRVDAHALVVVAHGAPLQPTPSSSSSSPPNRRPRPLVPSIVRSAHRISRTTEPRRRFRVITHGDPGPILWRFHVGWLSAEGPSRCRND